MLSDGQLVRAELRKEHCKTCQLLRHVSPPSQAELDAIFKQNYTLYARAPGGDFEMQRQVRYLNWVLSLVNNQTKQSLFEIGAGNGSFLLQLQQRAPTWDLAGLEPSSTAAEFARQAGFDIRTSTLGELDGSEINADIVIAINVLEHTEDPITFLKQAASIAKTSGRILIICPDGERPSSELLVYDHLHSFTVHSMHNIAQEAGLTIERRVVAPEQLGPFQAFLLFSAPETLKATPFTPPPDDLYKKRHQFLTTWRNLDEVLFQRASQYDEIWAFGCGENAQMLRTYASKTWSLVSGITADTTGEFDGVHIYPYRSCKVDRKRTLLLAVRPEVQATVAKRLQEDGHTVIRWDDQIE